MKSFQIVTLFALIAAAMAFAPNSVPQGKSILALGFVDTTSNVERLVYAAVGNDARVCLLIGVLDPLLFCTIVECRQFSLIWRL